MDWTRLVDIAVGAIFGSGLTGTLLQLRNQRRVEGNQRREQHADLLMDINAFFSMAMVVRIMAAVYGGMEPEQVADWNRVMDKARRSVHQPLVRLAHTHPSPKVRDLADQLVSELGPYLHAMRWNPKTDPVPDLEETVEKRRQQKAEQLLKRLRASI